MDKNGMPIQHQHEVQSPQPQLQRNFQPWVQPAPSNSSSAPLSNAQSDTPSSGIALERFNTALTFWSKASMTAVAAAQQAPSNQLANGNNNQQLPSSSMLPPNTYQTNCSATNSNKSNRHHQQSVQMQPFSLAQVTSTAAPTSNTNIYIPHQPQYSQNHNQPQTILGEHMLNLLLNGSRQLNHVLSHHANSIAFASYQINEALMTLWKNVDANHNPFYRKFLRISPAIDSLHKEIVQFYEYMKPLRVERAVRKQAVDRISAVIREKLDGVEKVSCFGSYKTGLCLPTSDIDLVVFGNWTTPPLSELKRILIESNIANEANMKALDRASVPILKLTDAKTGIRFDISFNMVNGTRSIAIIKEFLIEFPALRYLVLVLKHFLLQRYLNEVFTGGIGSYLLIMMTVSFLQLNAQMNCRIQSKCNLGHLLMGFFELYGRSFNYQRVGIRVTDGGSYVPKEDLIIQFNTAYRGSPLLCVEDPLDKLNDIGRGSYSSAIVCGHFDNAYSVLERCVNIIDFGLISGNHPFPTSILGSIIGVNGKIVEYRKYLTELFGSFSSAAASSSLDEDTDSIAESNDDFKDCISSSRSDSPRSINDELSSMSSSSKINVVDFESERENIEVDETNDATSKSLCMDNGDLSSDDSHTAEDGEEFESNRQSKSTAVFYNSLSSGSSPVFLDQEIAENDRLTGSAQVSGGKIRTQSGQPFRAYKSSNTYGDSRLNRSFPRSPRHITFGAPRNYPLIYIPCLYPSMNTMPLSAIGNNPKLACSQQFNNHSSGNPLQENRFLRQRNQPHARSTTYSPARQFRLNGANNGSHHRRYFSNNNGGGRITYNSAYQHHNNRYANGSAATAAVDFSKGMGTGLDKPLNDVNGVSNSAYFNKSRSDRFHNLNGSAVSLSHFGHSDSQ